MDVLLKMVGGFFVDEQKPRAAFKKAFNILKNREVLGMFPEGTRTKDGRLQEFEKGATRIAQKSGVPILPIGVSGTFVPHRLWESNDKVIKAIDKLLICVGKILKFFLLDYEITVRFGKPFKIDQKEDPDQATQLIKSKIFELLEADY